MTLGASMIVAATTAAAPLAFVRNLRRLVITDLSQLGCDTKRSRRKTNARAKARYSMIWSTRPSTDCGIVRPSTLAGLRLDHELEAPASLRIKTVCRARPDP